MSRAPFDLIAAAHTPFDGDGALDLVPVAAQVAHLRSVGVDGVLVAGSTGEGSSLTTDERRRLAAHWVEAGDGLEVMIQVGHASVHEAIELARHAAECGAAGICAAPPSWFPIDSPRVLADVCAEIASAAPNVPFLYYHIPVLSHVHVKMAALLDIVRGEVPNFAGIKFTHDDAEDFVACRARHDGVRMLWGRDEVLVAGLSVGAHGAVGSTYNFATPLYRRLIRAFHDGDLETANELQARAATLVDRLAAHGYAAAAKSLMAQLGVDCGSVRLPLARLEPGGAERVRADLDALGFFGWLAE